MNEPLTRTFTAELNQETDGKTLYGRCVPYGQPTTVQDPGGPPYEEVFERGSFRRASRAPQRVYLKVDHGRTAMDIAGYATELEERDDGLYGSFRTLDTVNGEQARELHRAGVLRYLSVGFYPIGNGKRRGASVVRTHCHLDEVSLCREAAYAGTEVQARESGLLMIEQRLTDEAFEARLQAVLASQRA